MAEGRLEMDHEEYLAMKNMDFMVGGIRTKNKRESSPT